MPDVTFVGQRCLRAHELINLNGFLRPGGPNSLRSDKGLKAVSKTHFDSLNRPYTPPTHELVKWFFYIFDVLQNMTDVRETGRLKRDLATRKGVLRMF